VGKNHATRTRYQPKRPRRSRTITNWSSRHSHLFLQSDSGHHGPHSNHTNSSDPSPSLLDIRHLLSVSVCRDRKSPKLATITAPVFGTETVTMNGTSLLLAQSPNELVVWLKRSRHESTPSETRVSTETAPTSPRESGTSNCGRSIIPGETLMESNRKLTYAFFGEQSAVMRLTPMK
jgi:hypothetical protein